MFHATLDIQKTKIENETKLIEHLFNKGKKGIVVQRYKGLGEMTPQQLWETTMNAETRSLLQVSIQDAVEADKVFTISPHRRVNKGCGMQTEPEESLLKTQQFLSKIKY